MKTIKNLYFLILCTLLLMPVAVMADNTLVIEPFDIKGGETKNLIIDLENDQAITLVQFDLQLPEGLSVEKRNGTKYMIGLAGNRTTLEDHSVSANFLTDPEKGDFYRVLLSSGDNIELEGTSGPVLSITIAAASTFKSGTIKLTGIELVSPNETPYHPAEVTLTILPSVTVTIQNVERAYGAANPEFTYTTSEEIDLTGKVTLATEATTTSNAGKYAITGTSTATDVNVTFVNAELTVTPAALTVTANAQNKVFGANDPTLTYMVTGLVNNDQLTGKLTRDEGENVGTYAIKQGTLAASSNYTLSFTSANLIIAAKTVATPTIEMASSVTYDGTAQKPAVTLKDGETTIPAKEYTVNYSNNTNVGTATVTITDKEGGNYTVSGTKTFTITPKPVTAPTIQLAKTSVTYSGTAQEPAVTAVKDGETTISAEEYTVSYSNNTNAGTATVTITDKEGGNYTVSGTKTFTITPKPVTAPTIQLAKTSVTYSGTAQEPAVTAVKDGETTISAEEYAVSYSNNTNAGTATVTITDKAGGNYTVSGTITFAITAKTVSNASITLSQESFVYDGTEKKPTVTAKDGETVIPASEYNVGYSNNTNVGTANVTITDKEGGNYTVSGSADFTVTKAESSCTAPTAVQGLVFNGSSQALITAGEAVGGELQYSLDGNTWQTHVPTATNAATYTVYYKVVGDANHTDLAAAQLSVTIAATAAEVVTIELSESTFVYDGTAKEPGVVVKVGNVEISSSEYTVGYSNNTNAGMATVTITDNEGGNYTVNGSITFNIAPKAVSTPTVELAETSFTYSGTAQKPAVTVKDGETTIPAEEYIVSYSDNTNAGTATITIADKTGGNYTIEGSSASFTITKATLTVTAKDANREEGEENPTFELTYSGFLNNETESVLTVKPVATTTATADSPAGDYAITVNGGEAQNYDFSYVSGTLTITEKIVITITAKNASREYGDANPTFEYTVTGGDITGTPELTCDATATSSFGEYAIKVDKGSITTNANFVFNNGTLTITKATLTVTASDASREEDEENPTFELTYSGFKNDETEDVLTVKPVATTTATANSPAGDYVITVSGGEAQNYDFSYVSGTLTVTEKEIIDGIATLSLEKVQGAVYTLSGQRVEQPRKGRLYIINGRKVVLK